MGDGIQFGRKKPDDSHGDLYLTVLLYDTPGHSDYIIRRADGGDVDLPDTIKRVNKLVTFLYEDLREKVPAQRNELMMTVRVFADSTIECNWIHDEVETPEGLAWLRRRLGDAYWSLDPRRGLAYYWHIARGKLRNLIRHQPKDTSLK